MQNRNKTIQFIKFNHPRLYDELVESLGPLLEDERTFFSREEVVQYNEIVEKYCTDYSDSLKKILMI